MATSSMFPSSPPLTCIFKPRTSYPLKTCDLSLHLTPSLILPTTLHSKRTIFYRNPPHKISQRNNWIWRISATSEDVLPSDAPIETTQQLISTDESGVSTIISVLLFIAFLGLSVLTIGVIYIAVTDFLQKREREKFEKEEATKKKKKGGRKRAVRARSGPRGFGQKIDEDYDDDD